MKRRWISLLMLGLCSSAAFANGGGYLRGGVQRAGDVAGFEPESTEKIRIVDEDLDVALGGREAKVAIRYLMRNETDKAVKVKFGFPIEELFDNDFMGGGTGPKSSGLRYCQDYEITAGGKPVAAKWKEERKPAEDKRFAGIAGWLVSEVRFGPGEELPVTIRFRSLYPLEEWAVSNNTHRKAAVFKYRLSTAACWAGTLGKGRITLRPDGIPAADLKVIKPVNRFEKDGRNWVWNFEDLEPALADDLEVEARPEERTYGPYEERAGQWSVRHSNYAVTASSTLPPEGGTSYDASNMKKRGGAWSEGAPGPGIGEWLELKPEAAKPLVGLVLLPGYWATGEGGADLFEANARPKTVLVELNGEFRTTMEIPDEKAACTVRFEGYDKPVKTVRLTFKDVWKGKLYEDLCVSGIRLHAKLDRKPELQPSR